MKKLLLALLFVLLPGVAQATTICASVPYSFVNGTTADATQVNSNFTAMLNCINTNAAHAGTNADITSLLALTAPPAGAGSLLFYGGTAGGTGNAITVAATTPSGFARTAGARVSFLASAADGSGGVTLNVSSTGAVALLKPSPGGLVAVATGDIGAAGVPIDAAYDGTEYIWLNGPAAIAGQVQYFNLSACPSGWSLANGSGGTVNVVGQFIRSLNTGSTGFDPNRTLASAQSNSVQPLTFSTNAQVAGPNPFWNPQGGGGTYYMLNPSTASITCANCGSETRPQNVALLTCQKN